MIQISELTEADKGREVRYTTHGGMEFGRITSWNDTFIFVRYHTKVMKAITSDKMWTIPRTGTTSEATRPEDLEFCVG